MNEQSQYAAAAMAPLIKSPSLRVPPPVELPSDIHALPESVSPYFVYPFTLEPHILTFESSRRSTLSAREARHQAYLRQREEDKERKKRDALRKVAPGFEPNGGPLVPTKVVSGGTPESVSAANSTPSSPPPLGQLKTSHARQRSVMDDLVDQLAAIDAASSSPSPKPKEPV